MGLITALQKLEDSFGKKENMDFYLDRDHSDPEDTSGNQSIHSIEKEQSTIRQNTSTEVSRGSPLVERTSNVSDTCHRQNLTELVDYNLSDTQATYNERCGSADAPTNMEKPLDCTSSDIVNQLQSTKHEPLDYTLDVDADAGYNRSYMAEKVLYNPEENAQRQGSDPPPSSLSVGTLHS